jgi:hypothetical protein
MVTCWSRSAGLVWTQRNINLKPHVLFTCVSAVSILIVAITIDLRILSLKILIVRRLDMLKWVLLMPLVLVRWHQNSVRVTKPYSVPQCK